MQCTIYISDQPLLRPRILPIEQTIHLIHVDSLLSAIPPHRPRCPKSPIRRCKKPTPLTNCLPTLRTILYVPETRLQTYFNRLHHRHAFKPDMRPIGLTEMPSTRRNFSALISPAGRPMKSCPSCTHKRRTGSAQESPRSRTTGTI